MISPFILAEADYLLGKKLGRLAQEALIDDVVGGAYELAEFGHEDLVVAQAVLGRYSDLGLGIADASVVVLASRYKTDRLLSLDERHFRALTGLDGGPITLLPADLERDPS